MWKEVKVFSTISAKNHTSATLTEVKNPILEIKKQTYIDIWSDINKFEKIFMNSIEI